MQVKRVKASFRPFFDLLEDRTVPATLVNPSTLTFQDIDGDAVRVLFSKPVLSVFNVNDIFHFDKGDIAGSNTTPQKLKQLSTDSISYWGAFQLDISIQVTQKAKHGDGQANVGKLTTRYQSLGKVIIQGDLGEYYLTSPGYSQASVQLLQVQSMGRFGPQDGETELSSIGYGFADTIRVLGDARGGFLHSLYLDDAATQDIGTLDIAGTFRGSLQTYHGIDIFHIGKNVDGTSRAKAFVNQYTRPGSITIGGTVDQFSISGSILGGSDFLSGTVSIFQDNNPSRLIQSVQIGGSIVGGSGIGSGTLSIYGVVQSVKISGSILGGTGIQSGQMIATGIGSLTVGGNLTGNIGEQSGLINFGDTAPIPFTTLTIRGLVKGGQGNNSGLIRCVPAVQTISLGGLIGSQGSSSGSATFLNGCDHVSVFGSIIGGDGAWSGTLDLYHLQTDQPEKQSLYIKGDIRGGKGFHSGYVQIWKPDTQIRIDGSIIGDAGQFSGTLDASAAREDRHTNLSWTSLLIGGSLIGGSGSSSGLITSFGDTGPVYIRGSVRGRTGESSGELSVVGVVPSVHIEGDLIGGSGINSGRLAALGINSLEGEQGDRSLDNVWIGGSIRSGAIWSTGDLGSIVVIGSILGTKEHPALIEADGGEEINGLPFRTATLGHLTVGHSIAFTNILVGTRGSLSDSVANVGFISIARDWVNSNLVVGFGVGDDDVFGTADDIMWDPGHAAAVDQIFIGRSAGPASKTADTYLFLAGQFNVLMVDGKAVQLNPGSGNDDFYLGTNLHVLERS